MFCSYVYLSIVPINTNIGFLQGQHLISNSQAILYLIDLFDLVSVPNNVNDYLLMAI